MTTCPWVLCLPEKRVEKIVPRQRSDVFSAIFGLVPCVACQIGFQKEVVMSGDFVS